MLSTTAHAQLPTPSKGWNLGNTLEPNCGVGCWGPQPTQALINAVAAQGFNTIRIPCAWVSNSTNGTINSAYMTQVKQVVNWCTAKGLYVILNDHWDGGWFESSGFASYDSSLNSKLQSIWTQVANNFNSYDSHVLFACTNEPNASDQNGTNNLFQYYRNWVPTIRNTGGNNSTRWLIVQGPSTNPDKSTSYISSSIWPNDPAKHLMLECHFYDPFQFTQLSPDASWGAMFYFWGSQYHVTSGPTNRNATWGEESYVDAQMDELKNKFANGGIPVLIGEFQASPKPSESDLTGQYITQNYNSCTYWNYYVHNKIVADGMYGTAWSIPGQMFDWTTGAVKDQNIINAALGKSYIGPVSGLGGGSGGTVANGTYKIINRNSGLAMDANAGGTANGTQIIQWSYGGGSNQKWTVTNTGGSNYKIIGVQSGRSLDINGFSSANGAKVQLWDYAGGSNQTFTFTATTSGNYRITPNCATSSCLEVSGGSTSNGANVQLWSYGGGNNQQWSFQAP
jgi:aryl-phospho-beta-D-glucosidase BglC (GH1 family)